MRSTGVMATTTTATDCEWSFLGAAGAPEAALVGSEGRREADTDPHPGAQSTESLCQVNITFCQDAHFDIPKRCVYFSLTAFFFFFGST